MILKLVLILICFQNVLGIFDLIAKLKGKIKHKHPPPKINPVCKTSYNGWIVHNHAQYYFGVYESAMSWDSASSFCKSKGGYLVEPKTSNENEFIKSRVPDNNH